MRDDEFVWQVSANCKGLDTNLFYFDFCERGPAKQERAETAKKVCSNCSVRLECLADALYRDDAYSIQGGTTPEDRGYSGKGYGKVKSMTEILNQLREEEKQIA